jgi:hypothetical protein
MDELMLIETLFCEVVGDDLGLEKSAALAVRYAGLEFAILPYNPVLWPEALRRLKLGWRYGPGVKVDVPKTIWGLYWAHSLPDMPPPKEGYRWPGRR